MTDIKIPLPNGCTLTCEAGTTHAWGGALTIHGPDGKDLFHWESQEWAEDPEGVIGAVFAIAVAPLKEVLSRHRHLNTGSTARQVTIKVGGKVFRCDCGCNVFAELAPTRYECNSCKARYIGEPLE